MSTFEGSREQTGCFVSTLVVVSAGMMVRATYRRIIFETDADRMRGFVASEPVFVVLACAMVLLAVFMVKLRRWAIGLYYLLVAAAAVFALGGHGGWGVLVPVLIGVVAVSAVLGLRREWL